MAEPKLVWDRTLLGEFEVGGTICFLRDYGELAGLFSRQEMALKADSRQMKPVPRH